MYHFSKVIDEITEVYIEEYIRLLKTKSKLKNCAGSNMVIKVNNQFVKRKDYPKLIVKNGDLIEIYPLLGGG